ncbi:MAG TPA: hypothetical protein VI299_16825 [Polyangiales bacterium]
MVHGAVVLAMRQKGSASEQTPEQPLWFELQVEPRVIPQPVPAPPAEPAAAEQTRGRSPSRAHAVPARPARVAVVPPVERQANAVTTDTITADTEAAVSPGRAQAPTLDLSPLAAARTLADSTYLPSRDAGSARNPEVHSPQAEADALARAVPGLRASRGSNRSVEGAVVDAVEDSLYNVLRPWKLFSKTMRGSEYRYTGAGFDASILPDGRVRFRDKDGPMLTVIVIQSREFGPGSALPPASTGGVSFGDPRALWHRLRGKDPHAAERRLFLERTRALREHLAGRASAQGVAHEDVESGDVEPTEARPEPPAAP